MFIYKFKGQSNYFLMEEPFDSSKYYLINPSGIKSSILRTAWTVFLGYTNTIEHGSEFGAIIKSWESDSPEQLIRSISGGYPEQLLSKLITKINDDSFALSIDEFLMKRYNDEHFGNLKRSLVKHGVVEDVADKIISRFALVNKEFRNE